MYHVVHKIKTCENFYLWLSAKFNNAKNLEELEALRYYLFVLTVHKNKPQKFPPELFMGLACANGCTKKDVLYNTIIQRRRLIEG